VDGVGLVARLIEDTVRCGPVCGQRWIATSAFGGAPLHVPSLRRRSLLVGDGLVVSCGPAGAAPPGSRRQQARRPAETCQARGALLDTRQFRNSTARGTGARTVGPDAWCPQDRPQIEYSALMRAAFVSIL
jgi:hypothetical protein